MAESYIVTMRGCGQMCRLGTIMFNATYAMALRGTHACLLESGIVSFVRETIGPLLYAHAPMESHPSVPSIDVAFVDDEAVVLISSNALALQRSLFILLGILSCILAQLRLEINWNPVKTECILVFAWKICFSGAGNLPS